MNALLIGIILALLGGGTIVGYELAAVMGKQVPTITDLVRAWLKLPGHALILSGAFVGLIVGLVVLLEHFLGAF